MKTSLLRRNPLFSYQVGDMFDAKITYDDVSQTEFLKFTRQVFNLLAIDPQKKITKKDIKNVIEQFRQRAQNTKEAGFDGTKLHVGNGYLADQFLIDEINKRDDEYGGSIQNKQKFLFECIDALISVFGADKVSVELCPTGRFKGLYDKKSLDLMRYILKQLEKKKISFVEMKRYSHFDVSQIKEGEANKIYESVVLLISFNLTHTFFFSF